jgi:hypothetical protein
MQAASKACRHQSHAGLPAAARRSLLYASAPALPPSCRSSQAIARPLACRLLIGRLALRPLGAALTQYFLPMSLLGTLSAALP